MTYYVESQKRNSDLGCVLPLIDNTFGESVEEELQLVIGGFLIKIMPLLSSMYSEPGKSGQGTRRASQCQAYHFRS